MIGNEFDLLPAGIVLCILPVVHSSFRIDGLPT